MIINILHGDCREVLKTLSDKTFHTCVTSPPYWALRDYGVDDQLGLEETPQEYVANLVEVFREVRRVLRDDGTVWLNLGDSYSSGGRKTNINQTVRGDTDYGVTRPPVYKGIKPKDLVGIPWRAAFALQEDGWYLRQDIIWNKPNPMPESVQDRCTKSHEYIFLLSKKDKYYYDNEAIKEKSIYAGDDRGSRHDSRRCTDMNSVSGVTSGMKNKRSVWTVATKPYKEAHFATYPPDLIEPCILAGCPEKVCVECGNPQVKEFYRKEKYNVGYGNQHTPKGTHKKIGGVYQKWLEENPPKITIKPSCGCNKSFKSGTVLDPFGGAGTTGLVADRLGRNTTLIELNKSYADIMEKRLRNDAPLFTKVVYKRVCDEGMCGV